MDPKFSNIHCGITLEYGLGDGSDRGVAFAEEYLFSEREFSDKKTIYLRNDTVMRAYTNEFNNLAIGYGRFFPQIGVNGQDDAPDSGDEGRIRIRVDREKQKEKYDWTYGQVRDNFFGWEMYPLYTGEFTFSGLNYGPDSPGTPVAGTTGFTGVPGDQTNGYWRGMVDPFGDEWHMITLAHDDHLLFPTQRDSQQSSDGRIWLCCLNPKTPHLEVERSGAAQFYTTPLKVYWHPTIYAQTTYFMDSGGGTVSFTIRDIYGGNVHYRINGGSWVNVGASSVTLTGADFANGTNSLEYYYNIAHIKTRTIVKNPTHPSLAENHGHLIWGTPEELARISARRLRAPYSGAWNRWKSSADHHGRNMWKSHGKTGHRQPWNNLTSDPVGRGSAWFNNPTVVNALIALMENSWGTVLSNDTRSLGDYAKEMLMGDLWGRLDPVGLETNYVSRPVPATELLGPGYRNTDHILHCIVSYDLIAAHYRSDQHARGMTPIEDYYIRDMIWSHSRHFLGSLSRGMGKPGLWTPPRLLATMWAAISMHEYSTPYYGTSGYGTVQTTYGEPETAYTVKHYFSYNPADTPIIPGANVETYNLVAPKDLFVPPAHWYDDNQGYFDLLGPFVALQLLFNARYHPNVTYPIIEGAIQNSSNGVMYINSGGTLYPGTKYNGVTTPGYKAFPELGNVWGGNLGVNIVAQMKARNLENAVLNNSGQPNLWAFLLYDDEYAEAGEPPADTTPPNFLTAPFVDNITQTSATLRASINEAGTLHALRLANGSSLSLSTTVVSTGVSAAAASGVLVPISLTGLTAGTTYHVDVVGRDTALNSQTTPTRVTFTTLPIPDPEEPPPEPNPTARYVSAIAPQYLI